MTCPAPQVLGYFPVDETKQLDLVSKNSALGPKEDGFEGICRAMIPH